MNTINLRELSRAEPPEFDNQVLVELGDHIKHRVFHPHVKTSVRSVDLSKLIGIGQSFYSGYTFGTLLRDKLKRLDRGLEAFVSNTGYFSCAKPKQNIEFVSIDGQLFVMEGKHRALLCKYLAHFHPEQFPEGPIIESVTVREYVSCEDYSSVMAEYESLLEDNPQLNIHWRFKYDAIFNGRHPELHNWEKQLWHEFQSVDEFRECMKSLSKTNKLKQAIGYGFHKYF